MSSIKAMFDSDSLVVTVPESLPENIDSTSGILMDIFESMRKNAAKTDVKTMSLDALTARYCNMLNGRANSASIPLSGKAKVKEYASMASIATAVAYDTYKAEHSAQSTWSYIAVTRSDSGKTTFTVTDVKPRTYTTAAPKDESGTASFDLLDALAKLEKKCVTDRQKQAVTKALESAKEVMLDSGTETVTDK